MKRMLVFLVCISCLLAGCNGGGSPLPPTATSMPTPPSAPPLTPQPPKQILCIMDGLEEDAPEFFATIQAEMKPYGWEIETLESPEGFDKIASIGDYDGILALHFEKRNSIQALVLAARNGTAVSLIDIYPKGANADVSGPASPTAPKGVSEELPSNMAVANYTNAGLSAEWILGAALSYPPHDTPVRMLGIFREEGSPASAAYKKAILEGMIFDRGSLRSQNEREIKKFLEDQLDKWIAGMLDCIFVEDLTLAQMALDVLEAVGRDDAEVFAIPNNNMAEQRMLYRRYVFPLAFGPDIATETKLQIEALQALMKGGGGEIREFGATIENMEPTP